MADIHIGVNQRSLARSKLDSFCELHLGFISGSYLKLKGVV
ncbi:MAG: hypothetical protein ACFFAS_13920 [Promethearchaeota archaeon]